MYVDEVASTVKILNTSFQYYSVSVTHQSSEEKKKMENEIKSSVLDIIGNTPIIALDRLCNGPGRILG